MNETKKIEMTFNKNSSSIVTNFMCALQIPLFVFIIDPKGVHNHAAEILSESELLNGWEVDL